jgi:putative integral membrane protein (TIGR02587 family)
VGTIVGVSGGKAQAQTGEGPWQAERDAYARAFGGAFLFGVPLLFTMEMWWIGEYLERPRLLALVALAFMVNVSLAYYAGFRRDVGSLPGAVAEAFEAMGVGIVVALVVLFSLHRLSFDDSLDGMLGMVVLQMVPLSIGASVAAAVFDPDKGRVGEEANKHTPWGELARDVGATAAGATFLGFAIAPTEEIPMLAAGLTLGHALAIVAMTMLAMYLIVFASGFDPEHRGRTDGGLFQRPFSETVLAYAVGLIVATALLVGLGQISAGDPLLSVFQQIIVLGVPASLGGAAGRIIT